MSLSRQLAVLSEVERRERASQRRAVEVFCPVPPGRAAQAPTVWPPVWKALPLEEWAARPWWWGMPLE